MGAADDRDPDEVSFAVVRHGFDRTAVREHVAELLERIERAEADRLEAQAQAAELQGELEIARREITALTERLDSLGTPEGADSERMVEVAKAQAAEITARAKAAAEDTWSAAEQASAALRDRYRALLTELDEQHRQLTASHTSIMSTAQAQAEELTTVAERRRRELDAEAERDRIRIDREFSESITSKREALTRELEARRTACEREVGEKLRAADEEARRRVESVTEQVTRLTEVRSQLSERLRGTQQLLERSAALLEPSDLEKEHDPDERLTMPDPAGAGPTTNAATKRTVPPPRAKRSHPAKR
ncbi:coiled-coil domain-containing protein [Actinophytocola xanthii]|uniref:Cellulose-binding protein n=1 Tax=Actinophytocola xanthii TaxID=1912961 RepID=A0A1Q8CLS7_9PSEU|nr:hypothetical protein [Actinophytocola xanthii]OLF15300.1 hypothetical protein BU204_22830 [Actinophytocola xanthii]